MSESNPNGAMGGNPLGEAASALKQMRIDMTAMVRQAKSIADSFAAAAKAVTSMAATGATGGGAGNTGAGAPTGASTSGSGFTLGRSKAGSVGTALANFGLSVGVGLATDATTSTAMAYQREWAGFQFGGQDPLRLGKIVDQTRNNFNTTSPQDFYGSLEGLANAGFNSLGDAQFSKLASTIGQASVLAGQSNTVGAAAMSQIYGGPQTYSLLAMGVSTMNANGDPRDLNTIADSLYSRLFMGATNVSAQDINRAFLPGRGARTSLEDSGMSEEQIQQIKQLFLAKVGSGGKSLAGMTPEEIDKASGYSASAPAAASQAARSNSEINKTEGGFEATATGIVAANELITKFNDEIGNATGALKDLVDALNATRGFYETGNSTATGKAAFGGIGGLVSSLVGGWAASKLGASAAARTGAGGTGAGTGTGSGGGGGAGGGAGAAASGSSSMGAGAALGATLALTPGLADPKNFADDASWWRKLLYGHGPNLTPEGQAETAKKQAQQKADEQARAATLPSVDPQVHWATGQWDVRKDMVAEIHKGEMVVPETFADTLRKKGSLADDSFDSRTPTHNEVHIHLSIARATDAEALKLAQSVQSYLDGSRELITLGAGRGTP